MAITILSFDTPSGNVVPVFDGGNFTGVFRVGAQFAASGDDACGVIEYRQYIKGEMVVGGVTFRKQVGIGLYLSSTDFQEDGVPYPGVPENITDPYLNSAYGYRAYGDPAPGQPSRSEQYSPSASNGCHYQMDDAPGFTNVILGRAHILDLTFQGVLIDTRSGVKLASNSWTVAGELR